MSPDIFTHKEKYEIVTKKINSSLSPSHKIFSKTLLIEILKESNEELLSKPQLNHNKTPRQPQNNLTQFNESWVLHDYWFAPPPTTTTTYHLPPPPPTTTRNSTFSLRATEANLRVT